MLKNTILKKIAFSFALVIFAYYSIASAFLSTLKVHELIAYQVTHVRLFHLELFPIFFGDSVALWIMQKKMEEEVESVFPYYIFEIPSVLARDASEYQFTVDENAEEKIFTLASFLIDSGMDLNIKNKEGCTSLHLAIKEKKLKAINFLISKNANLGASDAKARYHFCQISPLELAKIEGVELK